MPLSHFDERSGAVNCKTPWGYWYQTVSEVFVRVNVPKGTRGKDVDINISPNTLSCSVMGKVIFSGKLSRTVVADESTWTIEEQEQITILLAKAEAPNAEKVWESLLEDQFFANPMELHEMMKKLDLEKFQLEHPGFDFSGATLQKTYDKIPQSFVDKCNEKVQQQPQFEATDSTNNSNSRNLPDIEQLSAPGKSEWL